MYFADLKKQRTTMIANMHDGGFNEHLMNIELQMLKMLNLYLKEVDYKDVDVNSRIMKQFFDTFNLIDKKLKADDCLD